MTRRGPRPAQERLRRLLVMLPWLMERGSVAVDAMAARFGLTPQQLVGDLTLASMCGLPPYVDELVDLWFDDEGNVHAGVPRLFTRPLRLTPGEAFSLLAAVRAALALPGAEPDGALARAAAKLEASLGPDRVAVRLDPPPLLDVVQQAAGRSERLAVRYWSAGRDAVTDRVVAPQAVFHDRGNWYVVADDSRSGEERRFRIDRMAAAVPTGEHFERRRVTLPDEVWFGPDDGREVTVRVPASAAWVAERYPVLEVGNDRDGLVVRLTVVSEAWLARLLLRVGPAAEVLDPPEWRDLAARTARAVLARYGADSERSTRRSRDPMR